MSEGRRWELTIPGWLPPSELSANGRRRLSPWRQRDLTNAAKILVCLRLRESSWPKGGPPMERARLTITLVFPQRRRRDWDGLVTRVKCIPDCLVREGYLQDDDLEHLELQVRAEVQPRVSETRLTLEEIA